MSSSRYTLRSFDPLFAPMVVSWVRSRRELFWLAPGTSYPLTAAKVANWTRNRGIALLMFGPGESLPCGYGEINPMRTDPGHSWLGHLLIDPARRGTGLGSRLTNELVRWAFDLGGAGRLSLVVFPENLPAVACYHRCGFQLRGEETQQFNNQGPRHTLLRFEMFAPKFEGVAAERSATVAPESADSANR